MGHLRHPVIDAGLEEGLSDRHKALIVELRATYTVPDGQHWSGESKGDVREAAERHIFTVLGFDLMQPAGAATFRSITKRHVFDPASWVVHGDPVAGSLMPHTDDGGISVEPVVTSTGASRAHLSLGLVAAMLYVAASPRGGGGHESDGLDLFDAAMDDLREWVRPASGEG